MKPCHIPKFIFYVSALLLKRLTHMELINSVYLTIAGLRFWIKASSGDLGFVLEVICRKSYEVAPEFICRSGDVCVDVGAHIGCFSLSCFQANKTGSIFAIEPHPETFGRLVKNIRLNQADNIIPVHAAISSRSGNIELDLKRRVNMARVANGKRGDVLVLCYTLDDFVRNNNLNKIDLLKIDVEGHEIECLQGALYTLPKTHRIVLEFHSEELHEQAMRILSSAGFKVGIKETLIYGINQKPAYHSFNSLL